MISGRDFIVFSDDWGRHPFSCQHIMRHFLGGNRLLWVNTIGMRNPRLNFYDVKRSIEKIAGWAGKHRKEKVNPLENLTVLSPVMAPYSNFRPIRLLNRHTVTRRVKQACSALGFNNPIVITTLPNAADYIGSLGEVFSVYYCVDEFSEWPGVHKPLVASMERELLRKVDLIIATSEQLMSSKASSAKPIHLLKHGVDLSHFNLQPPQTPHPAFIDINKPIIGFFGLFDERFDKELIAKILIERPDWSVVIIGNVTNSLHDLANHPNLHLLGPIVYEDLPASAMRFDVCIAPYVINQLTLNINPLKFKEYLATGKPVVSTAIPEALTLFDYISVAYDHRDFIEKIDNSLSANIDMKRRFDFLNGESWQGKAITFSSLIERSLEVALRKPLG